MHVGPDFLLGLAVKILRGGCAGLDYVRRFLTILRGTTCSAGGYHGIIHTSTMALLQECIYLHENTVLYKLKTNLKGLVQAGLPLSLSFTVINKMF